MDSVVSSSDCAATPADVLKPGQEVKVKVLNVDPEHQRLGLSMKALEERQAEAEQKKAKEAKHRAEYDKKVAEREKRRADREKALEKRAKQKAKKEQEQNKSEANKK